MGFRVGQAGYSFQTDLIERKSFLPRNEIESPNEVCSLSNRICPRIISYRRLVPNTAHNRNAFDPSKGSAGTQLVQMMYRRAFDRRAYLNRRHFYSGIDVHEYANALAAVRKLEKDVIERLTVQQLRTAFSELSEKQRETMELFFFEGLTLAEIAERSGGDVKNTRHYYHCGLERLRQVGRAMLLNEKSGR